MTEGARTIGRYVLHGEIASGGMATVHFGRLSGPVGFARTVAIKRLHPQYARDPEFVTMFLDEARLAGRIRHPNVVSTLDVVATDGEIFLVMEYVQGESLARLCRHAKDKGTRIPPRIVGAIVANTLHGLHAAHESKDEQGDALDIVHRDVSPQNVLVGVDGVARVLDFGVAKATGRMQATRDGQVKGKLAYMAPEQLSRGTTTRTVDVYAAGVVLWEALTGERLFDAESEALTLVKVLQGEVPPPSFVTPDLPPEVDGIVLRALSKNPSARYQTAREFGIAVERTLGLASPAEVGEWVEAVAGDDLAARANVVAKIEHAGPMGTASASDILSGRGSSPDLGPSSGRGEVPTHPSLVSSASSVGISPVGGGARWRTLGVAAFGAGCALLLVAGASVATSRPSTQAPSSLTADAPARALELHVRPERATATAGAVPPSGLSVAPVAPVIKRPDCRFPSFIDAKTGRKKYRQECLN